MMNSGVGNRLQIMATSNNSSSNNSNGGAGADKPTTGPSTPIISKRTFYTGSLGVFSGSIMLGIYRVFKKENEKIRLNVHRPSIGIAVKALTIGTALCISSFAGLGAVFIATTGVSSTADMQRIGARLNNYLGLTKEETPESRRERELWEREMDDYLNNLFNSNDEMNSGSTNKDTEQPNQNAAISKGQGNVK